MAKFTRGFTGRRVRDPRLPPGQYDTGNTWPVLTAEATPRLQTDTWTFAIEGLVAAPTTWTWEQIRALPASKYNGDIHCVTTWSKLGMTFTGVSVDTLLQAAHPLPTAEFVVAWSHTGYTTNLPLDDVLEGKAWVVWEVDGEPLPREHGGPARLLVPHLYFWKSAKWVAGLRLLDRDEPGFWERNGYHDRGDPRLEHRSRRLYRRAVVLDRVSSGGHSMGFRFAGTTMKATRRNFTMRVTAPPGRA
jgi:DMSO/TMAO reductase YedYZ molybdopterin-dependent catalytic subunit